jgi:serine protease Do
LERTPASSPKFRETFTHRTNPKPAPAGAPEPNEQPIPIASWAPLIKRVMPTVVNVAVTQEIKATEFSPEENGQGSDGGSNQNGPGAPFGFPFGNGGPFSMVPNFQYFFGQMPRQFKQHGIGSGLIVSPDGYILTNDQVIGEHPVAIKVTLMDKREFTAKVVGTDPKTDLALLKLDTHEPLPYASLGDSRKVEVGDWVLG